VLHLGKGKDDNVYKGGWIDNSTNATQRLTTREIEVEGLENVSSK